MKQYIAPLVSLTMGVFLIVIGINMSNAQDMWDETQTDQIVKPGTKVRNAAVGAGVGAVGGGVAAALVGGFGIVVAGTGFGLPAGVGLIALAASLGAGAGAVGGAATGVSSSVDTVTTIIPRVTPTYETWQWMAILAIGLALLAYPIYRMKISRPQKTEQKNGSSAKSVGKLGSG